MLQVALLAMAGSILASQEAGPSFFPVRLADPKAVYLDQLGAVGDGEADDTAAIQKAIDAVHDSTGAGLLFVPSGTYRLTNTVRIWPGIRVIGFGRTRPTFVLKAKTPGFESVERFMVFFAGNRPRGESQPPTPRDASQNGLDFYEPNESNPGTFYSALSNINFEIEEGNPAAVAVRGRYAQHCHLAHIDFRLRSGLAAIHDTGNFAEDLRFFGGEYGIITQTPSPGWQFTLMDSEFVGQRKAGIRTHETGLTLCGVAFRKAPTAIEVEPGHTEQLWMQDGAFEDVSGPAILLSRRESPRLQVNLESVSTRNAKTALQFRGGESVTVPDSKDTIEVLSHGLTYSHQGAPGEVKTVVEFSSTRGPRILPTRHRPLDDCVPVTAFGAVGDGQTDDTGALQNAANSGKSIYFPSGKYRITGTVKLSYKSRFIGLNPITTQIVALDRTPAFAGLDGGGGGRFGAAFAGPAVPLIESSQKGSPALVGLGIDAGGNNPAACAVKWMAGEYSLIQDVKFLGGHGSGVPWNQLYAPMNAADGNPDRKWDSQPASLWVTNGGGGAFKDIWTASPYAAAGMLVSDTSTRGAVFQMSSEHHVRAEVQLRNVRGWKLVALQTEEERGEGPFCLPLEITNSSDITVANLNCYRVISVTQPFGQAVRTTGSHDVRFRGVHCYSNSKASFDSLLLDATNGVELRQREFSRLDLTAKSVRRSGRKVKKLAGGFFNISGGVADSQGGFYFVDAKWHRIWKWSPDEGIRLVSDQSLHPINLAIDRSGRLLVVSYAGRGVLYSLDPAKPLDIQVIKAVPAAPRPDADFYLPVSDWGLPEGLETGKPLVKPWHYVSPDGSTVIPAGQDFVEGALSWGIKSSDILRSFGLAKTHAGEPFVVVGESPVRSVVAKAQPDGSLAGGRVFVEQGSEGAAVDRRGRVILAAGQVLVYSPKGELVETIDVPERPTQVVLGGKAGTTLFITARTSLYEVDLGAR